MKRLYFNRKRVLLKARGQGTYGYFGFTWRDVVGMVGYFVGQLVLTVLFMLIVMAVYFRDIKSSNDFIKILESNPFVLFGPFLIIGIGLIWLYWHELKHDAKDFWCNKWRIVVTGVLIWGVGMILLLGYGALMELLFGVGEKTSENQDVLNEMLKKSSFIFVCFSVVIIPFIEEIVFRKILFTHFGNSVNYIVSSIVSVLIFGFIHVMSELLNGDWIGLIMTAPAYLIISLVITVANYRNKNFFAGYFVHLLHNAVVTSIMILGMNIN